MKKEMKYLINMIKVEFLSIGCIYEDSLLMQ